MRQGGEGSTRLGDAEAQALDSSPSNSLSLTFSAGLLAPYLKPLAHTLQTAAPPSACHHRMLCFQMELLDSCELTSVTHPTWGLSQLQDCSAFWDLAHGILKKAGALFPGHHCD